MTKTTTDAAAVVVDVKTVTNVVLSAEASTTLLRVARAWGRSPEYILNGIIAIVGEFETRHPAAADPLFRPYVN